MIAAAIKNLTECNQSFKEGREIYIILKLVNLAFFSWVRVSALELGWGRAKG